eukprot:TRINITY_DN3201_c0_g6_i1.p1 TRINITY_DN3201_c0_g6~~TRINITY_DN3201_c0_g6_i1.p1  ORF type:complete len:882 (-),score=278.20 TRINITY_DN3201_c0_g6_i1:387-3032(-)
MSQVVTVNSPETLDQLLDAVRLAQKEYSTYSQEQVDKIFAYCACAANQARIPLAKQAVKESGMGIVEDKVIKNHFASELILNKYRDLKTCDVIERDAASGITRIAEPMGIIAGIVPTTNPTSTTIFKCLIALKTRNAIVFSPHPRAKNCTIEAARIVRDAAVKAGAPENLIGWIDVPSVQLSGELMKSPKINLILATGGPGMVKAAYSSGSPALGVGPGNTPVLIDETADIEMAVSSVLMSKTFDNGVVCASEQSCIVVESIYEKVRAEFIKRGAYVLSPEEKAKVAPVIIKPNGALNADIVGQPAYKIAEMGGVTVPKSAKVLIGECEDICDEERFSHEKLSPTLGLFKCDNFEHGLERAVEYVSHGGLGHTSCLYTNPLNEDRISKYRAAMSTGRVLLNSPASQGAIGDLFNFQLAPSLTLGCGSWGGNSVSVNVGPMQLLNIKSIAERRENMQWFRVPPRIYFKYGALPVALSDLKGYKRCFLVSDRPLFELGYVNRVTDVLAELGIAYSVFFDVEPDPKFSTVETALSAAKSFEPDLFIALGGGSVMDAAKIVRLLYEHPEVDWDLMTMRFLDIRKRVFRFPALLEGTKSILCCIPTTSGTGSEVTPFSVVTDQDTGVKYPIADYELTPQMAIIDPQFVMSMPKGLVAATGMDVLTHAIESYVSIMATPFTDGLALEAIRLVFKYLEESTKIGSLESRSQMHYAAAIAGMAFANAFLGVNHSLAHKIGQAYHVPHGLANALLLSKVIKYNATDSPTKQGTFSQYEHPVAVERYAQIARHIGLTGETDADLVIALCNAIDNLNEKVGIPSHLNGMNRGVPDRTEYMNRLEEIAEFAFDDQCTSANPRYPLITELMDLLVAIYSPEDEKSVAERLGINF